MLSRRILKTTLQNCLNAYRTINNRKFCDKKCADKEKQKSDQKSNLPLGDAGSKYQVFRDEDSEIIFDVTEERLKYASALKEQELEVDEPFAGINLERGITGVFEIEDLVAILKRENAENLLVAAVPPEFKYVKYMCLVSAKSYRHMLAIAQFVRRVYKHKRHPGDIIPKLEGRNSKDWMAIDLGNIALHIFSREARATYDLDSLWSVGPDYDKEYLKKDPVVEMLENHAMYLKDLQPAS